MSDAREWLRQDTLGTVTVDFWKRYVLAKSALLAVLEIHREYIGLDDLRFCCDCEEGWPCVTVRAIDKALGVDDE